MSCELSFILLDGITSCQHFYDSHSTLFICNVYLYLVTIIFFMGFKKYSFSSSSVRKSVSCNSTTKVKRSFILNLGFVSILVNFFGQLHLEKNKNNQVLTFKKIKQMPFAVIEKKFRRKMSIHLQSL